MPSLAGQRCSSLVCFSRYCSALRRSGLLHSSETSWVFQFRQGNPVSGAKGKCTPRARGGQLMWTPPLVLMQMRTLNLHSLIGLKALGWSCLVGGSCARKSLSPIGLNRVPDSQEGQAQVPGPAQAGGAGPAALGAVGVRRWSPGGRQEPALVGAFSAAGRDERSLCCS